MTIQFFDSERQIQKDLDVDDNTLSSADTPYYVEVKKLGKRYSWKLDYQPSDERRGTDVNNMGLHIVKGLTTGRIYSLEYENRQKTDVLVRFQQMYDSENSEERRKRSNITTARTLFERFSAIGG